MFDDRNRSFKIPEFEENKGEIKIIHGQTVELSVTKPKLKNKLDVIIAPWKEKSFSKVKQTKDFR